MYTLPPHLIHKIQPLDVVLFGVFKNAMKYAEKNYLAMCSGRNLITLDLLKISKSPFEAVFVPSKIEKAFKSTGLWLMDHLKIIKQIPNSPLNQVAESNNLMLIELLI